MAGGVVIRWRIAGFEEVRRLPGVKSRLQREAQSIAAEAGEGYEAVAGEGKTRSRAAVVTASLGSVRDNARNNTLNRILARRRKSV